MNEQEVEAWIASIEEDMAKDEERLKTFQEVLAELGPDHQVQLSPEDYELLTADREPPKPRAHTEVLIRNIGMMALHRSANIAA